ncbi:MAG: (p)ppGpp synthetase [Bacteroidota bacterium]|nr:(p)ppGpp synthetase [Bacteroidota bacterium]
MADQRILDAHCSSILQEYKDNLPLFREVSEQVYNNLKKTLSDAGLILAAIEYRVKTEDSLAGKLELKGSKYASLKDITDIIGLRVITFYTDDVEKVASAVERMFTIDWANSIDKRKAHEIDSFGYLSLHYICSMPDFPYRFEIQMRTILQHAWANMNHDTGYKSGVEVPRRYFRNMSRLAGMLELIDDEFSKIRSELTDYRRKVQALVASGNLDEVALDGDAFRSYLNLKPFANLNKRIASVNQAEIQEVPLMPYLAVFKGLGFNTLGDVAKLIKGYSDAAYQLACYQIGLTDLDIISSSLGPQDLCITYILKTGGGKAVIKYMFDTLNGPSPSNEAMADFLAEQAKDLPFMNQ